MKAVRFFSILIIFASCLWGAIASAEVPYLITKNDVFRNIKRSVEIRIAKPMSEKELEKLAYEIRDDHRTKFERTFIGWRIQGVPSDTYWATTHFNPDLKVRILFDLKDGEEVFRWSTQ